MENWTPEMMEMKKKKLHKFLFTNISSETMGAHEYLEAAELAHKLGMNQTAQMLMKHAKDEANHSKEIIADIKRLIPNLDDNPLSPLLENSESWLADVMMDIQETKI